jgi:hypothetical protein
VSWTGVLTAVNGHLVTVGAALDPPITAVRRGEPFSLLQPTLAYWYDGDQESSTGGRTLAQNNVEEKLIIRGYWTVPNRDDPKAAQIEDRLQLANRAIQASLWADVHLNGNCIGLAIASTSTGWQQWGEAWLRVLTIPVFVDMAWVEPISI